MKLKMGIAAVGVLFGIGLIGVDALNGTLFDPSSKGVGVAGVATAATFGLLMVK